MHTSSHAWEIPDDGLSRRHRESIPPATWVVVDLLEPANATLVLEVDGWPYRTHAMASMEVPP